MIRVFVLDDHQLVRQGIVAALDAQGDMTVVGEASTIEEGLDVVLTCHPDVAVLDVRVEDGNGIELCRSITAEAPATRSLILTSFPSDRALVDASRAGAAGFVLKQIRSNDLIDAIRHVAHGRQLLDDATVRAAARRIHDSEEGRLAELTPQESRIFQLIGQGMTNRQIAEEVHLAEKTIKNYVSNLLTKLGMSRRTEAAALAARVEERSHH